MGEVILWLSGNWETLVGTAGTIVMGASLIVLGISKLTANKKDDEVAEWLKRAHTWLSKIALNPPKDA